jgi:6-hydroxynicotinate reductase
VKQALTRVTSGGAPVYVWPGGGITFMVDVSRLPENAFGYVPTPALVAPIEFTLTHEDYAVLGGYMDHVRPLSSLTTVDRRQVPQRKDNPWPTLPPDGRRFER